MLLTGNLFVEHNGCVKTCSFGYHENGQGECIRCKNEVCDKGNSILFIYKLEKFCLEGLTDFQ